MLNKNAQAWVDALRSGDYKQSRKSLHIVKKGESRFCCLGLACHLYAKANPTEARWVLNPAERGVYYSFWVGAIGEGAALSPKVCEWLGLVSDPNKKFFNTSVMFFDGAKETNLIVLNDRGRRTFDQIADIIEANQKELFNAE